MPVANPVESTFATVRLRTDKTKGCLSPATALAWSSSSPGQLSAAGVDRTAPTPLAEIVHGVRVRDGEPVTAAEDQAAA
jgi:hypothetical protein